MATAANKTEKKSFLSMQIGGGKKSGGKKSVGGKKPLRGKFPVKQSINLVIHDKKTINPIKAAVLIAVIVLLAGAFSKFMVIDRFTALNQATGQVSQLRTTLATTQSAIESYGELKEKYAHYTYSGMTDAELSLVDRTAVLELAEAAFSDGSAANNWQLVGNVLTAQVTGKNLEELNQLAQLIQESPIVDRCVINTANKTLKSSEIQQDVTASFTVYLQQPVEEETAEGGDQQ